MTRAGLRVNIKMDFYNNWEAPGLPASRSTGFFVGRTPIICILTLDPSLTWTDTLSRQEIAEDFPLSRTQMIDRRRQGIQFSVETSGELGQFDFGEFTKTVVNALVLLGTVDTFLILFARFGARPFRRVAFFFSWTDHRLLPRMAIEPPNDSRVPTTCFSLVVGPDADMLPPVCCERVLDPQAGIRITDTTPSLPTAGVDTKPARQ